jgi:hypothetical protein
VTESRQPGQCAVPSRAPSAWPALRRSSLEPPLRQAGHAVDRVPDDSGRYVDVTGNIGGVLAARRRALPGGVRPSSLLIRQLARRRAWFTRRRRMPFRPESLNPLDVGIKPGLINLAAGICGGSRRSRARARGHRHRPAADLIRLALASPAARRHYPGMIRARRRWHGLCRCTGLAQPQLAANNRGAAETRQLLAEIIVP